MTRIVGLTMRSDAMTNGENRISVDTEWFELLENKLGFSVKLLPFLHRWNNTDIIEAEDIHALILTGGNDSTPDGATYNHDRNIFEYALLDSAIKNDIPVIGICRGMQILNLHQDGKASTIQGHVGSAHTVTWNGQDIAVNSFHNYGIMPDDVSPHFDVTARAMDGSIEGIRHKTYPWHGVMWHPERSIENSSFHIDWVRTVLTGGKAV